MSAKGKGLGSVQKDGPWPIQKTWLAWFTLLRCRWMTSVEGLTQILTQDARKGDVCDEGALTESTGPS